MRSILIRVYDRSGSPVSNARVTLGYGGGVGDSQYTDGNGETEFRIDSGYPRIWVYVDGKELVTDKPAQSEYRVVV